VIFISISLRSLILDIGDSTSLEIFVSTQSHIKLFVYDIIFIPSDPATEIFQSAISIFIPVNPNAIFLNGINGQTISTIFLNSHLLKTTFDTFPYGCGSGKISLLSISLNLNLSLPDLKWILLPSTHISIS
jgi:hypothetical protein